MKHLVLIIGLLTSSMTFSQCSEFVSEFIEFGKSNSSSVEFTWYDRVLTNINIVTVNNVLSMEDENESAYILKFHKEEDGKIYWNSRDERGKRCVVTFEKDSVYVILTIEYAQFAIRYYCLTSNN